MDKRVERGDGEGSGRDGGMDREEGAGINEWSSTRFVPYLETFSQENG